MNICFVLYVTVTTEIYTFRHTLSLHAALPFYHAVEHHRDDALLELAIDGRPIVPLDCTHGSAPAAAAQSLREREIGDGQRAADLARVAPLFPGRLLLARSEEHTSELQSLMRISYAVFCLKNNNYTTYLRDNKQ